ncbi:MAG: glycosyltransferase family 2 protein [Clostridiales bacterium]|nr:glycosyltransferase family 2 protein [Clostridiales bacterium]
MKVQVLVSAMNKNPVELAEKMNLSSDAIIINQCNSVPATGYEVFSHKNREIRCYHFFEKGVGLSRNNAFMRADRDICLFSDEDIVYVDNYEDKILAEFEKNPKAHMIVFQIDVEPERRTYEITKRKRLHFFNAGRYGAVSFAIRTESLKKSGVTFSLLFGGGAKYSNGEDSLFIKEFMAKGYRAYTAPVTIGREEAGESSWFSGYHDKFFIDRGVLYHSLYGWGAKLFALRFLMAHRKKMCVDHTVLQAYQLMCQGIKIGKE